MKKVTQITQRQKEFIPLITKWLSTHHKDESWVMMGSRVRETGFFIDLLYKVELLGEYTIIDGEYLNWITKEYYKGRGISYNE